MSVRMRLTHSKTGSRRAHHKKSTPHLVATKTGARRRHFVDPDTGMYRGKQIITMGDTESNKKDVKPVKKGKKESENKKTDTKKTKKTETDVK